MKIAVIGLDGVGFPILDRVFEHEAMPYLKDLIEKSARGILKSTVPPYTPTAWTSIASGVNPGKHGVLDFVTFVDGYKTRIINALDVKYPRIHEMIAIQHMKSVCVNLVPTYPITFKLENCMVISDWLAPKISYYPKLLERYVKNYPIHVPISSYKSNAEAVEGLYAEARAKAKVACSIMEREDWDLFWFVYNEPDHILHRCYEEVWSGEGKVLRIFEVFDQTIRKATEIADLTVIVSDHGFSDYRYVININSFLNELGLIKETWKKTIKDLIDFEIDDTTKRVALPRSIYKIASVRPIKTVAKKIFRFITKKDLKAQLPFVDLENSKAFMGSSTSSGIYVKDTRLIDSIIKELKRLKGVKNAWRREEIYCGPFLNKMPEIFFIPDFDNGYFYGTSMLHPKIITTKINYQNHHPDGIIVLSGRGVNPSDLGTVKTFDVIPTILRYMGLPLPVDTDGTPIPSINYPSNNLRRYDYLKHWQLIRRIQAKRAAITNRLRRK